MRLLPSAIPHILMAPTYARVHESAGKRPAAAVFDYEMHFQKSTT